MDNELKRLGLRREVPVGKRVGDYTYFHISYMNVWGIQEEIRKVFLNCVTPYNVVKYNRKNKTFSLIYSPGFNTEHEPAILSSFNPQTGKTIKYNPDNPPIYHHKWMFVGNDYRGFDVEESKRRSIWWKSEIGNNRKISSRIGYKRFWEDLIKGIR
jgi:hypothetical protein